MAAGVREILNLEIAYVINTFNDPANYFHQENWLDNARISVAKQSWILVSFQLFRAIGEKVNRIDFYGEQMYFYFFAHYVVRTRNFKLVNVLVFPLDLKSNSAISADLSVLSEVW